MSVAKTKNTMALDKTKLFPKRPRLKQFHYTGRLIYFITILTHKREPFFVNEETFSLVFQSLNECAGKFHFTLLAYCFMPDHVHLLVQGETEDAALKKFIHQFKQKSGFAFKRKTKRNLWHISFYDHILRKEEDVAGTMQYILNNPVRKGMVGDLKAYPFCGSLFL